MYDAEAVKTMIEVEQRELEEAGVEIDAVAEAAVSRMREQVQLALAQDILFMSLPDQKAFVSDILDYLEEKLEETKDHAEEALKEEVVECVAASIDRMDVSELEKVKKFLNDEGLSSLG